MSYGRIERHSFEVDFEILAVEIHWRTDGKVGDLDIKDKSGFSQLGHASDLDHEMSLAKFWEQIACNDSTRLVQLSKVLREHHLSRCALRLAEEFFAKESSNEVAASLLCAALRAVGQPNEALRRTDDIPPNKYLATSRAAAWCDIGNFHRADQEARQAWRLGSRGEHIDAVFARIRAADRR